MAVHFDDDVRAGNGHERDLVLELGLLAAVREERLAHLPQTVDVVDELLREPIGAGELHMADVHDVSGRGTEKTYGRLFCTKGKSLIS